MVDLSYRTAHVKFRGRKCEITTECFREWRVHAVTSHHSFTLVRGLNIYWHSPCNPGASTSFLTVLSCHFASPLLSYVSLSQTQSGLSLDKPSLHLCWFQFQVTLSQWLELQAVLGSAHLAVVAFLLSPWTAPIISISQFWTLILSLSSFILADYVCVGGG